MGVSHSLGEDVQRLCASDSVVECCLFGHDANFGARSHAHLHLVTRCKTIGIDGSTRSMVRGRAGDYRGVSSLVFSSRVSSRMPVRLYFAIGGLRPFRTASSFGRLTIDGIIKMWIPTKTHTTQREVSYTATLDGSSMARHLMGDTIMCQT